MEQLTQPLSNKSKTKIIVNIVALTFIFILFLSISICIITNRRVFRIVGHSMNPTFYENNIVMTHSEDEYNRGDIVAFRKNGGTTIKRIIGKSGDIIEIEKDGRVAVNGKYIDEPYVVYQQAFDSGDTVYPYIVPKDEYFVLGDNRANSEDSRKKRFGCIPKKDIIGKVDKSLIPYKKMK